VDTYGTDTYHPPFSDTTDDGGEYVETEQY
jgi:DNA-directed RNA polymerase subunit alpha